MLTTMEILEAVRQAAETGIPQLAAVYIDVAAREEPRPSLWVRPEKTEYKPLTANLAGVKEHLVLTLLVDMDGNSPSEVGGLLNLQQQVMDLFRSGYLKVCGRAVKVLVNSGGRDASCATVDLELEYHDECREAPQHMPMMEQVETTVKMKG